MPALLSCAVPALFALCLPPVLALPTGAPLGACSSLMPSHSGISPQTSTSPHTIAASSVKHTVEVMIIGANYRGLLLQGRELDGNIAVGSWTKPPNNTKVISCFNMENSAITNSNTEPKTGNMVYNWNPPRKYKCGLKVVFVATVAQSREVYWTGLKSDQIEIHCPSSEGALSGFATVMICPLVWLTAF